ncbi:hypothetical protein GU927_007275 [Rhodobacteraceae bacterium HSP-20]|uniref:Integrase n=1 Tax=Paragemmobacter amnigenus TaxID=2852097 RepID=A0ABS6J1L2_9RHOB|nr:hypothetical protein [Rhodobacter amnigenus]MBU9697646.1 hypothetical protein [Rhodobacter amnigenus]MBV4388873.1 hypothetical protein [Rhodobacter amnigenus]
MAQNDQGFVQSGKIDCRTDQAKTDRAGLSVRTINALFEYVFPHNTNRRLPFTPESQS